MPRRLLRFPLTLLCLSLAACSTTRGGGYDASLSQDSAAVAAAKRRQAESAPPPVRGGGVPSPGSVHVEERDEDEDEEARARDRLMFELVAAMVRAATTGYLAIEGLPPGAAVFVDGSPASIASDSDRSFVPGDGVVLALQAGPRRLRVEAFGYAAWESLVAVEVQRTLVVAPTLSPLAFGLEDLELEPLRLPSRAPGPYGKLSLSFRASAPGEVRLEILDEGGRTVHRGEALRLSAAENRLSWKPPQGLRSGTYLARIRGEGLSLEAPFELVDLRSSGAFSPPLGGLAGTLLAPDARVLPSGSGSVAFGGAAVLDPRRPGAARGPLFGGMRLGLGIAEITISGLAVLHPGYDFAVSPDWGSVAGGLKLPLLAEGDRALALAFGVAHGSYFAAEAAPAWDGLARFPGVEAGLVLESDGPSARAFISAHVHASDYYPGWSDIATVPGFYAWAYLRGGVELYSGDFLDGEATAALSLAARSAPFGDGLAFAFPLSAGLELHHYPRDSALVLSVYGLGEWAGLNDFYLGAGLGLGFAF